MMYSAQPEGTASRVPGRWERLAWLPIPVLLTVIVALWVADLQTVYESRSMMVLLNLLFTCLASLTICFLTARGFMAAGQPCLLMFGCGTLLWGSTSLTAAMIIGPDVNSTITVHNLGIFGASLCHFAGMVWSGRLSRPGRLLASGYAGALMVSALIFLAAISGWTPLFFVQGHGGTLFRQLVLLSAITIFAWVALQMFSKYKQQSGVFYYWYGLGLALVATGLIGVLLLTVQGGLMGWTNRLTQYMGSVYLFIAAFLAVQETGSWRINLTNSGIAGQEFTLLNGMRQQTPFVRVLRYFSAAVVVIIAFGLRIILESWVGPGLPTYIIFYPAMMFIIFISGFGPGILSTILIALISAYWILPPVGSFFIASSVDRLGLAIFTGTNLIMCIIAEMYQQARKKAAAYDHDMALRESEAKYRNLFENMTEEVHFWKLVRDEDGRIRTWMLIDANPPTLKTWGRTTLDEIKGKTSDEIFGPGSTDHYMPVVQKIMTEGKPHFFEDYFANLDKYFRFTSVPLGDYFITTGADITDIIKAELALRESEERLRLLTDNLPESAVYQYVHELDGEVHFIYASAGIERLNCVTLEEVSRDASALHRQIPPECIERLIEAEARSKRELSDFDMELPMHRPDGEIRWMRLHSRPRRMPDGRTVWDGVQTDITERRQAQEGLRLSEERFRGLVEQTPEGIFVADAQGRYLDVNPAGAQMLGYTQEEICRMCIADVVAPEEFARIPEAVARLADGTVDRNEWRFRRRDGSFFIGEVVGRQLQDGRLQGILRDVTVQKQVETMLKNLNEELELRVTERTHELANNLEMLRVETSERLQAIEALREKEQMLIQQSRQAAMGEMIGNIAHQWRQPLNSLGLYTQRLGAFYGMPGFNKEFLDNSIAKSMDIIKHMSKTIDDFRDYFKPEKEKNDFYVIEAIKSTMSLLEGNFNNPKINIDFIEQDNPVINGYQNEFSQVFLNILNNARDALIEREIAYGRIIITICSENSCAVVTVADNAGGIPDEIINKVFDPYFTTKGPQTGTGIGLFMSKTIIEKNMGGKLTVRNTEAGAEFRIEVELGT